MDLVDDEESFLRDLVKASRQKAEVVTWTDRDGTARTTSLKAPEVLRLDRISRRLGLSKAEVLRQAAYIPTTKERRTDG